ncbi:hypothetical protein M3175_17825 [Robertmurraya korlensis]|uniref:hypothetical protein n=1 Tax=Robertmurraya korlensis TaxID=519977 RepID=UPI00203F1843|nr:hypothetical protein [Robertmurraya korlensis]MCM3602595.1 hypothetical protein [Robertmurraya korlensis]
MKTILQAVIASIILHIIYIFCTIGIGYLKTMFYKPSRQGEVYLLQNEVAYGMVISPYFYLISLLVVSIICAGIIALYNKIKRRKE